MEESKDRRLIRYGITVIAIVVLASAVLLAQVLLPAMDAQAAGPASYPLSPLQQGEGPTETPTNTPTSTNTPTTTHTPTPTATGTGTATLIPPSTGVYLDPYEPNNDFQNATLAQPGLVIQGLTLWPPADQDYFRFAAKAGSTYEIFTRDLAIGLDTELWAYDANGNVIAVNDDYTSLGRESKVIIETGATAFYFIRVINKSPVDPAGRTYRLEIKEVLGTLTPTPTPTGTRIASIDDCEPNDHFGTACVLELGALNRFDFVPGEGTGPDNDFFRIWVKQGLFYTCETSNLSSVNDTNMIFYSAPSTDAGIGGNDDKEDGEGIDLGSELSYLAQYTGWLYILVGPVPSVEYEISNLYTYEMVCEALATTPTPQPSPTTTPRPPGNGGGGPPPPTVAVPTVAFPTQFPTPTQLPPELFNTPQPTPRPSVIIIPLPTATPATGGSVANLDITLYYDANNNFMAELNEGIIGASIAVYDDATGELLAFGYTNDAGNVRFGPLATSGTLRLSVPFLNFSQVLAAGDATIFLRVAPQPLPIIIP